jgi:hypothetical protein
MTTQPPTEEQKAAEADEEELKGWPHQAIQDLDEGEREALLKAGGPVGEAARLAWQQYEHAQAVEKGEAESNVASGEGSGVGAQEPPPAPPKTPTTKK